MKAVMGDEHEFLWGQIYHMIKHQNVSDACLEDILLYVNIRKSGITKKATHPELFPCAEVIRWIIPQEKSSTMIISNVEGKEFASFTPTYITKSCKLPVPQTMMTDEWVKM